MFHILHYDRVGSTNDEARRLAAEGAAHGTVVHADEQTSGRGRLARAWFSPAGNLYLSILLRLDQPPARIAELSFAAAVSVADMVAELLPKTAEVVVKWPNDVLVDGGKIAGILLEGSDGMVIVGIGVNVLHAPSNAGYRTTTLVRSGGIATVDGARDLLLAAFGRHLTTWLADGFMPIRSAWLARSYRIGAALRVGVQGRTVEGSFAGLDIDGALLLETPEGPKRIVAGDVAVAG
ncbi:MAG: biotin--[acetyl-CoA-carboxylase] ligase [Acetobacteraceae bacterium]